MHGLYSADGTRLVLRRYVWPGFLEDEPIAPRREVDALRFGPVHGLPVPEVVAADITGADIGDGVPVLLMTFLPGRAVAAPDAHRLAEVAAAIHATDPAGFGHAYFPWYAGTTVAPPPASRWPALWETAIGLWHDAVPAYTPTFVHRDFHPGNVLWSRGRVAGVVDWANACAGPLGLRRGHLLRQPRRPRGRAGRPTTSGPPTSRSPARRSTPTGTWHASSRTGRRSGPRAKSPPASRTWRAPLRRK